MKQTTRSGMLSPAVQRWAWPALLCLASRVVCLTAMYAGYFRWLPNDQFDMVRPSYQVVSNVGDHMRDYAADPARFGPRPMLGLQLGGRDRWLAPLVRWDSFWYLSIALEGYVIDRELEAQHNVVFFPLYPAVLRAFRLAGLDPILSGLVLNGLALTLAACLLFQLVERLFDRSAARWATALWLFFPTSLFASALYSEALAGLLAVWALGAWTLRRRLTVGLVAGIASAIRPQGLLLGLPLIEDVVKKRNSMALVGLLLSVSGLACFMIWLAMAHDDPWLFVRFQRYWRPAGTSTWNLLRSIMLIGSASVLPLLYAARGQSWRAMSTQSTDPYLLCWGLYWLPAVYRLLGWGVALSTIAMFVLPLSTGGLVSVGRFTWLIVPVFVAAGQTLAESRWRWPTLVTFTAGLIALSILFGGGWQVI